MKQQIGAEVTAKVADEAETQNRHQRTAMFVLEVVVEAEIENMVKKQFMTLPMIVMVEMVAVEIEDEGVDERNEEDVVVDGEKDEEVVVATSNEKAKGHRFTC